MSPAELLVERADRKDLWLMLAALDDARRTKFMRWAASRCPARFRPQYVPEFGGTAQEAYVDLLMLNTQYGLDLLPVALRLQEALHK